MRQRVTSSIEASLRGERPQSQSLLPMAVDEAVERSTVSSHVNTTFVERFNGTARQHNSRKARGDPYQTSTRSAARL